MERDKIGRTEKKKKKKKKKKEEDIPNPDVS